MLMDSEVKRGGRDPGGSLQRHCQCPPVPCGLSALSSWHVKKQSNLFVRGLQRKPEALEEIC